MGNSVGKFDRCFIGDVSGRHQNISVNNSLSDSLDEGFGHSFCYIRPHTSKICSDEFPVPFRMISGASISANTYTPLTTTLIDPFSSCTNSTSLDRASSFESSPSFASVPLQPIPHNSGPFEGGFLSGPIQRSSILSLEKNQASDQLSKCKPKLNKCCMIMDTVKKAMSKSKINLCRGKKVVCWSDVNSNETVMDNSGGNNLSTQSSLVGDDDGGDEFIENRHVEWAQGKAGEDRVHVVVSEEHGWVYVGIYDGFSGPDATDFLLGNLYSNVYKELKGLQWNDKPESVGNGASNGVKHSDVLKALSEALRKTEESFLEITDTMVTDNPELALMGSCVLVMLMKGDDVYLMNVGDSRAVLAQKLHLERIVEETSDSEDFKVDAFENVSSLAASQLTFDHCTSVQEEVKRIKSEHLDDSSAIIKNRVKGSLMVTRAFGAGFLKQPKWNNALLEMFRIDYVGDSPYLNCLPWLRHHSLGPKDKFLILSSDGLYQYFTNEEAVAEVDLFNFLFPEGDPAQHLVEEVLFRAAKKAGLKFQELLDIPQGDRRKYHDDVSIVIISFQGRIWRSSL
ncbi:PPM-type phosphatase domain-containing protein [Heracleum sosnowskyi]|uniref:PPM-type phosphatase domain-containing protein n=1 Tax=Heracleum sosnowskyi TaxID=360622 RepID=A0AAD8NCT1_9APIA|nr:PPM-type phosphatase domain-containing protein [Heracleum sosnowskyi]